MSQPSRPERTGPGERANRSQLAGAGLAGVAAVIGGLVLWGGLAWAPALAVLGLAALAGLAWQSRRAWGPGLVGPLFYYELVRQARRRAWLLRCAYALVLLAVLQRVYSQQFPDDWLADPFAPGPTVPIAKLADFAGNFVFAVVAVQLVAAIALTPAYLAGAVVGERENRTLDLLLTTALTDREIVLGKLFGGLAYLAAVLLAGLPVLAITQLWGGVPVGALVAGAAVTGLTLLGAGSICMLCSVWAPNRLAALFASYAVVGGLFGYAALQVSGGALSGDVGGTVFLYAAVTGLISVSCLMPAVRCLRSPPLDGFDSPATRHAAEEPFDWRVALRRDLQAWYPRWPVSDRPLVWKEVYHGTDATQAARKWRSFRAGILGVVALALIGWPVIGLAWLYGWGEPVLAAGLEIMPQVLNLVGRMAWTWVGIGWCVTVGFRAAGAVVGERERRTLDSLLVLPLDRREILKAKWLGGIGRGWEYGWLLAGVGLVGLVTGAFHPVAVLLLALVTAAYLVFLAGVGLWLSVVCRKVLTAQVVMAAVLLAMFGGSFFLTLFYPGTPLGAAGRADPLWSFVEVGLNPTRTWLQAPGPLLPVEEKVQVFHPRPVGMTLVWVPAGAAIYAAAGGLFWLAACRRFPREGAAGPGPRQLDP